MRAAAPTWSGAVAQGFGLPSADALGTLASRAGRTEASAPTQVGTSVLARSKSAPILGLLGFPVLQFLDAGFFFHNLTLRFLRDPGVVGEIDFSGLIEVDLPGVVGEIDFSGLIEVGVVQGWGETVD